MADTAPDDSLQNRLAAADTPEEVLSVLGRRRVLFYELIVHTLTLVCAGVTAYLVVSTVAGWKGPWVLGWVLATAPLAMFFGQASYGALYRHVTGRQPPPSRRMARILDRLSSDL